MDDTLISDFTQSKDFCENKIGNKYVSFIPKSYFKDKRLTPTSIGILAFLHAMDDDFIVSKESLQKYSPKYSKQEEIDVEKAILTLEKLGFLVRVV